MTDIILAIPSETTDGISGSRSDHFGHCPAFTIVKIKDNQIENVESVGNIAHGAGGCMKPVAMLAENGVNAMVVAGMGAGPFHKMQQFGIKVYYAGLSDYPDIKSTLDEFINGNLPVFEMGQLCTGSGNCHH